MIGVSLLEMDISSLQARQGKVDLEVEVVSKEEPREFSKFGKNGRVCNAVVKDSTGQIKLTLWNDDIDNVKVGDKLKITNGYVGEWQGELQLSTGKFGSMEVVESGSQENSSDTPSIQEETLN
jgi:replication factor A1